MLILGSTYGFSGAGWCITSVFFVLMVRLKFSQTTENLSTLFCMLALVVVISEQKFIDNSLHLGFSEVEARVICEVSNVDSNI